MTGFIVLFNKINLAYISKTQASIDGPTFSPETSLLTQARQMGTLGPCL